MDLKMILVDDVLARIYTIYNQGLFGKDSQQRTKMLYENLYEQLITKYAEYTSQ